MLEENNNILTECSAYDFTIPNVDNSELDFTVVGTTDNIIEESKSSEASTKISFKK
jgi:hypothetical protein